MTTIGGDPSAAGRYRRPRRTAPSEGNSTASNMGPHSGGAAGGAQRATVAGETKRAHPAAWRRVRLRIACPLEPPEDRRHRMRFRSIVISTATVALIVGPAIAHGALGSVAGAAKDCTIVGTAADDVLTGT